MPFENYSNSTYIASLLIDIPSGQSTVEAIYTVTVDSKFYQLMAFLENTKVGDTVELQVGAIINGVFQTFKSYGVVHLPSSPKHFLLGHILDVGAEVPAGTSFKMIYNAIDTLGRTAILWFYLRK